jgi:hypothetical protein
MPDESEQEAEAPAARSRPKAVAATVWLLDHAQDLVAAVVGRFGREGP